MTDKKLIDLDPVWLMENGLRIGFAFQCPTDPAWHQVVLTERRTTPEQWAILNATRDGFAIRCQTAGAVWTILGGIESADFDTITVTPSVDGSPGGLWHGFIVNGVCRGC